MVIKPQHEPQRVYSQQGGFGERPLATFRQAETSPRGEGYSSGREEDSPEYPPPRRRREVREERARPQKGYSKGPREARGKALAKSVSGHSSRSERRSKPRLGRELRHRDKNVKKGSRQGSLALPSSPDTSDTEDTLSVTSSSQESALTSASHATFRSRKRYGRPRMEPQRYDGKSDVTDYLIQFDKIIE
jgi:hypothetical protein